MKHSMIERPRLSKRSLAVTLLLAAVLLFFALRGIEWDEVFQAIVNASLPHLGLAWIFLIVSYALRTLRWRVLLSATKLVPPLDVFWATCTGYLGNNFLPARAGEILRTVLLGRRTGISKSFILATALTERLMDAITLVLISLLALTAIEGVPAWLQTAAQVMAVLGIMGLALLFALPRLEPLLRRLLAKVLGEGGLRDKLFDLLSQFLLGMAALQHTARALKFVGLTIIIWLSDTVIALIVAQSLGLQLTAPQALLLLAALGLASAAPSTPGYIGVYHFVARTVLAPFGFTENEALAYIITFQAVTYTMVTLFGLIGLWRINTSTRQDETADGQPPGKPQPTTISGDSQ